MKQFMKYDAGFSPLPIDDGDEIFRNGIFEFNISKLYKWLGSGNSAITITEVEIADYYREFSSINDSHVDSVDLDKPVILAEISPGRYNLIDGNHRVEKARRKGINSLPCYRVNAALHVRFLTNKSAYIKYVEYWNDKA
ncbi:MAG: ParB N-terminal domain-containing protein [Candidatus Paceibacterota bacterium]